MSNEEIVGNDQQGDIENDEEIREEDENNRKLRNEKLSVITILIYYVVLLIFAFWLLFDLWGESFKFMHAIGVKDEILNIPYSDFRIITYTILGGFLGGIFYHIRMLHKFYAKIGIFNPRWLGKYITGPWEGAGLALIVLALIRGGIALVGGSMGTGDTAMSYFTAFGIGALVGFTTRDVIKWINKLAETVFTFTEPKKEEPENDENGKGKSETEQPKPNEKLDKST